METFDIGVTQNDDIALMFLDTPITEEDHVFLPTDGLGLDLAEGMDVDIVGWGQQSATSQFESSTAWLVRYKICREPTIDKLGTHKLGLVPRNQPPEKCHEIRWTLISDDGFSPAVIGVTSCL